MAAMPTFCEIVSDGDVQEKRKQKEAKGMNCWHHFVHSGNISKTKRLLVCCLCGFEKVADRRKK